MRLEAARLFERGESPGAVAAELRVTPGTVRQWRLRRRSWTVPADDLADVSLHSDLLRSSQLAVESSQGTGRPIFFSHISSRSNTAIPRAPGPPDPTNDRGEPRQNGKDPVPPPPDRRLPRRDRPDRRTLVIDQPMSTSST
ncbi:helix-turn-helix domain-containing protein [Streptomyces sp. ME02-8801-2C]|uniref:helix-turn-helix domain-containing protein n=1 Tax=Streptomyces sp. ME02-8801-2C TaxID=3028680 RepID=UPI0039F712A0